MGSRPDKSALVSVTRLAEITGMSRWWARDKLDEWLTEQENGGPQRVICRGKRKLLYTTIAVVQREFIGVHDPVMKRKMKDLEELVTFLGKRVDGLSEVVNRLVRRAS